MPVPQYGAAAPLPARGRYRRPVTSLLAERVPRTLLLGGAATIFGPVLGAIVSVVLPEMLSSGLRVLDVPLGVLLSGGVDSTVAAALVHEAIGDRQTCIFVDNGLLREGEFESTLALLRQSMKLNIKGVRAGDRLFSEAFGPDQASGAIAKTASTTSMRRTTKRILDQYALRGMHETPALAAFQ